MNRSFRSHPIAMVAVCLLLMSCGGGGGGGAPSGGTTGGGTTGGSTGGGSTGGSGGGSAPPSSPFSYDVGVGGTGGIVGPVTRFGSIVINGLVLSTDDADFYIEDESGGSQSDLREGQQVIIAGDIGDAVAEEVFYRSNLKGPLTAAPVVIDVLLGTGELQVLGQTVRVSSETRFVDASLETLLEGDLVEVSGTIDPNGVVFATFVGGVATLSEYKAIGFVSALSAGGFDLAGLEVDSTAASLEDFPDDMLANGQLVEVKMPTDGFSNPPAVAVASEIELLPSPEISEGAELEIEGLIDRFVSPTDFSVNGIPVTTDAGTEYEDGDSSLLRLGIALEVEGVADAEGVVVADKVEIEINATVRYEGPVVAVDPIAGTVTTELGLIFETDEFTELEDDTGVAVPFSLSDLNPGDYVEVRAFQEEGALITVELERDNPDTRVKVRGRVTAFDEAAGTASLLGITINEADTTTSYSDRNDQEISRAQFYQQIVVGAPLEVEWDDFVDAAQLADELSLEEDES